MSRFSITSPDELSIACTRRLILSPDADTIRRAEQDLGMTKQQCADHIFQKTIVEGFPMFADGIDSTTPDGRLQAVRWLFGWLMSVQRYGWSDMTVGSPDINRTELND